jgi:hypothetical protein
MVPNGTYEVLISGVRYTAQADGRGRGGSVVRHDPGGEVLLWDNFGRKQADNVVRQVINADPAPQMAR